MAAGRPRVFLDIHAGNEPVGRLTIELFTDQTPKTCENFRQLCTGEHNGMSYAETPFHRVIDEFMVQGGDIANSDGTGTASIYGGEFEDENLTWREMDAAGLVCAANRGKDTNGSQFFITLESCPHLNGKHTIFGRLVSGQDVLQQIASVQVNENDCPITPVLIARCGELEKRKKVTTVQDDALQQNNDTRGRPRRSDASSQGGMIDDKQDIARRNRRQSDNVIDEGLRGRPRQRSPSLPNSRAASSTGSESNASGSSSHSRVAKHKRKRSQSPSRHQDRRFTEEYDQRRQRSLPNQYREMQRDSRYHDHDRYRPSNRVDHGERSFKRQHDRYRPRDGERRGDSGRLNDSGRLGGNDYDGDSHDFDPPVKFKGRGNMKYRENRYDGR